MFHDSIYIKFYKEQNLTMLTKIEVVFVSGEVWALTENRHEVIVLFCFLTKNFSYMCVYICQNSSDHILKISYLDKGKNDTHVGHQKQECFLTKSWELIKSYSLLCASSVHLFKTNLEKKKQNGRLTNYKKPVLVK